MTEKLTQKEIQLAELRERIEENGALEQGFSTKLLNHIDPWVLAEAVRYVATECPVDLKTDNITIQAMIIDKALVVMNTEEFEAIAPYFLGTSKIFGVLLMSKLTKDELETLEWICLVGSLKIKELEETADSEKMVLLHKHKENIMKLLTKNWNE